MVSEDINAESLPTEWHLKPNPIKPKVPTCQHSYQDRALLKAQMRGEIRHYFFARVKNFETGLRQPQKTVRCQLKVGTQDVASLRL